VVEDTFAALSTGVGVDHCGFHVFVAEEFLHGACGCGAIGCLCILLYPTIDMPNSLEDVTLDLLHVSLFCEFRPLALFTNALWNRVIRVDSVLSCVGDKDGVVGRHNPVFDGQASPSLPGFLFYRPQAIGAGTVEG